MADTSEAARTLKRMRRKANLSVREMAKQLGWSATRYQHYEDRYKKENLPVEVLEAVTPILLAGGVTNKDLQELSRGTLKFVAGKLGTNQGLVFVPLYDVAAPSGAGTVIGDEHVSDRLAFRVDWLSSITRASPEDLGVITVRGDSMFPTLVDGDTVLVDFSQRSAKSDGIFVVRYGDAVQVKRVSIHPDTQLLTVKSDNKEYSTFPNLSPDRVDIVGRVVWLGRRV